MELVPEDTPTFKFRTSIDSSSPRCSGCMAGKWSAPAEQAGGPSIDVGTEIGVRVDDMDRHVDLFLVDLSANGVRFRSGVKLPDQAGLSFKWSGPSREPLLIHGHVASIKMLDKRTAEYDVKFKMPPAMHTRLVEELTEAARRQKIKAVEATGELPARRKIPFAADPAGISRGRRLPA